MSIRFVISEHVTKARGRLTFQDTPSEPLDANRRNPCRNGSQPPRSADRRLRVVPGRPAGFPRRMPGEARRRNFVFWTRAGLPRPSKTGIRSLRCLHTRWRGRSTRPIFDCRETVMGLCRLAHTLRKCGRATARRRGQFADLGLSGH